MTLIVEPAEGGLLFIDTADCDLGYALRGLCPEHDLKTWLDREASGWEFRKDDENLTLYIRDIDAAMLFRLTFAELLFQ